MLPFALAVNSVDCFSLVLFYITQIAVLQLFLILTLSYSCRNTGLFFCSYGGW